MDFISVRKFRIACSLYGAHAQISKSRPLAMALSAEPGRRATYDKDLRWRIIYQRVAMGLKFSEIAKNLNIAVSTAHSTSVCCSVLLDVWGCTCGSVGFHI